MQIDHLFTKRALASLIISIFLLFAGYFSNNMSILTGENLNSLAIWETANGFVKKYLGQLYRSEEDLDSVIYINTSFDKYLINYYDKEDFSGAIPVLLGNTEITDRRKLLNLLKLLQDVDYKYLIIDIRFAQGLESDSFIIDSITGKKIKVDDELFDLIKRLDKVIIATHHDIRLINKDLEEKAALADYKATATSTNFVRYEYFDSIPYIPMAVYNDLNKREGRDTIICHISSYKWLKPFAIYTQGANLCYNSLFLDFSIKENETYISESGKPLFAEIDYLNLSKDILEEDIREDIVQNFKDRYIIIGNITEDLHDTYAGPQPGSLILYKALKALNENKHIVSPVEILLLFIIYFLISFFILSGKNILDIFRSNNNSLSNFIVDITSFTIIFWIYHFIEYVYGRTSFSFVIPIITFTILKTYKLLKDKYKMKQKFLISIIALLSSILMLMSFRPLENDRTIKIHSLNSDRIYVDGKIARTGMMISPKSHIKFVHPKQWIKLLNMGKEIVIPFCEIHKKEEAWRKGEYRKVQLNSKTSSANLFWWITWHGTTSKGADSFEDIEYVIGEERPFEIEETIPEEYRSDKYYEFEIIDGKYKGKKFRADPDSTDPLIWISRELLNKNGITLNDALDKESYLFKVTKHSFDYTSIVKDSLNIVFIK